MYVGYGFGAFERVWSDNRSLDHQFDDSAEAHNDYLRIALELGLVGLFVYVALLARLVSVSMRGVLEFKKNKKK